jgi:hypothetical protein
LYLPFLKSSCPILLSYPVKYHSLFKICIQSMKLGSILRRGISGRWANFLLITV